MTRKIILNLAISLDGFIADTDGGFAWIKGDGDKSHDTKKQFEYLSFLETVDTIIMGKKAFLDSPEEGMAMFKSQKIYVASSEKIKHKYDNVEFTEGNICRKILELKEKKGKNIWLYGGGGVIDPFIKADIIDEYIIGIIPIILGKGIPLFHKNNPTIELHLDECTIKEGVTILKYTKRKG